MGDAGILNVSSDGSSKHSEMEVLLACLLVWLAVCLASPSLRISTLTGPRIYGRNRRFAPAEIRPEPINPLHYR